MREQLSLSVGETVYGLGERFGPFVKNGQTVDMWQADGGTCSEQPIKCAILPYQSNYGVFVTQCEDVSFEVASEVVSRVSFTVPGQSLGMISSPEMTLKRFWNAIPSAVVVLPFYRIGPTVFGFPPHLRPIMTRRPFNPLLTG